jgi:DNA-binding NtrC family response regulator
MASRSSKPRGMPNVAGDQRLDTIERRHILGVLRAVRGNKARAAQILGINLTTIYRKLARYRAEGHEVNLHTCLPNDVLP